MADTSPKTFPGVYTQITDQSFQPPQVSRFRPAFIGVTSKGPFDTPTRVRSLKEFTQVFGRPVTFDTKDTGAPKGTGYYVADAVQLAADYTNDMTIVRIGNHYQGPVTVGTVSGLTDYKVGGSNAATAVEQLRAANDNELYLKLSEPSKETSVSMRVTGVAGGEISFDSGGPALADEYLSAEIDFSPKAGASSQAEGVLYAYQYSDKLTTLGTVKGDKNSTEFELAINAAGIVAGDVYKIKVDGNWYAANTYEIRVKQVVGKTVIIETTDQPRIGYQAVALQDNYGGDSTNVAYLYKAINRAPLFYLKAKTAGEWANGANSTQGLYIRVRPGSVPGSKKMEVFENGALVETHDNLSEKAKLSDELTDNPDYYEERLKASQYVEATLVGPPGGVPLKRSVALASTTNVAIATATAGTVIDGGALTQGTDVLLTAQTSASQNGSYVLEPDYGGDEQGTGSIFTAGAIPLTGLGVGMWYWFTKGNATNVVGTETLTADGLFRPTAGGTATINGPAGQAYTGVIVKLMLRRTSDMSHSADFVTGMRVQATEGTANKGLWEYTGTTGPVIGTTALPWTKQPAVEVTGVGDGDDHVANTVAPWDQAFYGASGPSGMPAGAINAGNLVYRNIFYFTGGQFDKGSNGQGASEQDFAGVYDSIHDVYTGIQSLKDPDNITCNMLFAPMDLNGFSQSNPQSGVIVMDALFRTARSINAMAITDVPPGLNATQATDWHNGAGSFTGRPRIDSANIAIYWNWFTMVDRFTNLPKLVPPSIGAVRCFGITFQRDKPWYAAAGETRGYIPEVQFVEYDRVGVDTRHAMYGQGNSVNPILKMRGQHYIYGERTMQRAESKLTAIHNVILVNYVVDGLSQIGRRFVFDPNDLELLVHVQLAFSEFLDKVRNERGIEEYSLVVDQRNNTPETRNRREVIVDLSIVPTDVAERIFINAIVRESGAVLNAAT